MKTSLDLLRRYNESPVCDWDLIVITARDESQRRGFERQLDQMKRNQKNFITNVFNFLVVSDQELAEETNIRTKLGSGGSTLLVLRLLVNRFGEDFLRTKRVLLIPSGGYSQRLPHYSVLGKLFSNLPIDLKIDDKCWTALDVKLALIAPMSELMIAGVFVTASDDIVIYSYDDIELKNLPKLGADCVLCLGHPSNVDISVNHGVYVIPNEDLESIDSKTISFLDCLKVLQKPTFDELNKFNAFVRKEGKEFCITDSSYCLGPNVIIDKLLKFPIESIDTEIDCYAHFLCPLGSEPLTKEPDNRYISPLNDLLMGTKIKVLFFSQSKFFHLGTLREYIFEMTDYGNKELATNLNFKSNKTTDSIKGTIICSKINSDSIVDKQTVVEFCDFSEIPIRTTNNLLYNCHFSRTCYRDISILSFPANHLIFSVPISIEEVKGWTTFGCHLDSHLKSNLWSQKVFPVCETSSESLISTLRLIDSDLRADLFPDRIKLSISDIKDVKDMDSILDFQNRLKI